MIKEIDELRKMQWYIIQYYKFKIPLIKKWINRAKELNIKDDRVQILIMFLSNYIDFYTHMLDYSQYEEYESCVNIS